jgi:hypothetical protein
MDTPCSFGLQTIGRHGGGGRRRVVGSQRPLHIGCGPCPPRAGDMAGRVIEPRGQGVLVDNVASVRGVHVHCRFLASRYLHPVLYILY